MAKRSKAFPRLVGVLHLPALPGAPRASQSLERIAESVVSEARLLEKAGFDALILENFGDAPFFKSEVPPITIAALTRVVSEVARAVELPLGVNVLRNAGSAALAVAEATGAEFIRVNILSGAFATDQGIIEGCAATLLRERAALGSSVRIWGDILVKHARPLSTEEPELAVEETISRGGAEAVIVTGTTTGRAVDLDRLQRAARAADHLGAPTYIGSGCTPENWPALSRHAYGAIVGSAFRKGGRAGAPIDLESARAIRRAFKN